MKKVKLWIITLTLLALILTVGGAIFGLQAISKIDAGSEQKVDRKTSKQPQSKPQPPTRDELLKLVNEERAKVGVAPLQIDERLNQSAQYKADDMVKYNYFNHVSPNDNKHGYQYVDDYASGLCVYSSENIIDNVDPYNNSAGRTISGWVTSKPHYKAMVNPKYTLTGFGISGTKIVEHFCQQ